MISRVVAVALADVMVAVAVVRVDLRHKDRVAAVTLAEDSGQASIMASLCNKAKSFNRDHDKSADDLNVLRIRCCVNHLTPEPVSLRLAICTHARLNNTFSPVCIPVCIPVVIRARSSTSVDSRASSLTLTGRVGNYRLGLFYFDGLPQSTINTCH